jgi:hypothetical protein
MIQGGPAVIVACHIQLFLERKFHGVRPNKGNFYYEIAYKLACEEKSYGS